MNGCFPTDRAWSILMISDTSNNLTAFDVSGNPELQFIHIYGNYISSPDNIIGWQELGLWLAPEGYQDGWWETLYFWPQRTPADNE